MKLVIFGRSPFINNINVDLLISKYQTLGFNYFPYPVDFLFSLNENTPRKHDKTKMFYHWQKEATEGTKIAFRASEFPLFDQIRDGFPCYAWQGFGVSPAINWAIHQGFTDLYLAGIDHVETDKRFIHHDNIDDHRGQNIIQESHKLIKQYIYNCSKYIKIYQCNIAVKDDWHIPFCPIEDLYD